MQILKFELFEKKSEKTLVETKRKKCQDKISHKKEEIQDLYKSDQSSRIKAAKEKIKRVEIEMLEKELLILELREKKTRYKEELKDITKQEKKNKE